MFDMQSTTYIHAPAIAFLLILICMHIIYYYLFQIQIFAYIFYVRIYFYPTEAILQMILLWYI